MANLDPLAVGAVYLFTSHVSVLVYRAVEPQRGTNRYNIYISL